MISKFNRLVLFLQNPSVREAGGLSRTIGAFITHACAWPAGGWGGRLWVDTRPRLLSAMGSSAGWMLCTLCACFGALENGESTEFSQKKSRCIRSRSRSEGVWWWGCVGWWWGWGVN